MLRILLVDDQAPVRSAISVALQANGFAIAGFEDAMAGLRAFQTQPFDLAIIDVYMPGIDGVRLIKALRERSPNLPVIAISGILLNASEHTALDFLPNLRGMSGVVCLKKPFRPRELLDAVEKAVAATVPPEQSIEAADVEHSCC